MKTLAKWVETRHFDLRGIDAQTFYCIAEFLPGVLAIQCRMQLWLEWVRDLVIAGFVFQRHAVLIIVLFARTKRPCFGFGFWNHRHTRCTARGFKSTADRFQLHLPAATACRVNSVRVSEQNRDDITSSDFSAACRLLGKYSGVDEEKTNFPGQYLPGNIRAMKPRARNRNLAALKQVLAEHYNCKGAE